MISLPEWLEKPEFLIASSDEVGENCCENLNELPLENVEQIIVKDLLFCLIGGEGNYIRHDGDGVFRLLCKLNETISSFVDQIIPLCTAFFKVRRYAEGHYAFEHGRTIHALCHALKSVVSEFIQLIAKLDTHHHLTLPLLIANTQSPSESLLILGSLVSRINSKRGVEVLSEIHASISAFRGSLQTRKMLTYLFQASCVPLIGFVEKWIYNGVIDDPFDEFFVQVNEITNKSDLEFDYEDHFWVKRYSLIENRLPRFISKSALKSILSAGKSIAVLSNCGLQMPNQPHITLENLQRETVLDSAAINASLRLVNALRERYRLLDFLKSMKVVFFCFRGDWLTKFSSIANKMMKEDPAHVHIPALESFFSSSLPTEMSKCFSLQIEKELVSDQVMRIHSVSSSNSGSKKLSKTLYSSSSAWDFLNIYLKIEWPISLLFNSTVQSKYQLLFRTQLIWRRLEMKFSKSWKKPAMVIQFDKQRHAMNLFASGYIGFTTTLVINPLWSAFEQSLKSTTSIDAIFTFHEQALDDSLNGFFISNQELFRKLMHIAMIMTQYIAEYKKWIRSVENQYTSRKLKIGLGSPMQTLFSTFEKEVSQFLQMLESLSQQSGNALYTDFINWINVNGMYL